MSREVFVPRWLARPWRAVWSFLTRHPIDAVTIGYTRFYLVPDPSPRLRRHELEHVWQARRMGLLRFWGAYVLELVSHGYYANRFEVEAGSFVHARGFGIERFSQYPEAIAAHKDDFAGKAVVTFCTGGIRCEKAVLYMNKIGMDNVYQLDGGILKYFEEVGGAHWAGNCVVFDDRNALDPALRPVREPLPHR